MADLPKTHKALVLTNTTTPPTVQTIPTPQAGPGSLVVRVELANVVSYAGGIYDGSRKYTLKTPLTIGTSGIGRVVSIGPDTTSFLPGDLVLIDSMIRARDEPTAAFLLGIHAGHSPASQKLMEGEWRDATYAEYAKVPLENVYKLDEKRLLGKKEDGGLGLKMENLTDLSRLAVPMGGLADIGVKSGDTVIVAPATAAFGGGAVIVALALGARVVAMGRNVEALKRVKAFGDRVETVQITGDVEADTQALLRFGSIDAFFDISPPEAAKSTHLKSAILALRNGGRVSLMGGIREDLAIPHHAVMHRDLQIKGKWMYSRENVRDLIKMAEVGLLDLRSLEVVGKFGLEEWEEAFKVAKESATNGGKALIAP